MCVRGFVRVRVSESECWGVSAWVCGLMHDRVSLKCEKRSKKSKGDNVFELKSHFE